MGGESVSVAEWARWHLSREAHHSPRLTACAAHLLRVYGAIKDNPERLREHIAFEKSKAKRQGGKG